ncbi:PTS sugar transporter subunit IIA [Sinorhizobium fredii]|uniref:PTS sugar transporter subunit IIA n=1 Tax=Rhizobium fredii TaxID=380 RepID=UPI0005955E2F|nr:PTS sugar transporter subunit IIA [Sinorhizobium fredii]WOS64886.1 PTS sugar transporter subunit IIA [Sinorhizobium fredii GR64]
MKISDILTPERVVIDLGAASKGQLLHRFAESASRSLGIEESEIFRALSNREKLASTGIGEGIAIPHAPVRGIKAPFIAFVRLKKPIDFESIDDIPVDIVCFLLTPTEGNATHLNVLAAIARKLRSPETLRSIRAASAPEEIYLALLNEDAEGEKR